MAEGLIKDLLQNLGLAQTGDKGVSTDKLQEQEKLVDQDSVQLVDFTTRLNKILSAHQNEVGGHVYRIGLEGVEKCLGSKWDNSSQNIHETIHRIIEGRLGDQELYIKVDDLSYLLVFSNMGQIEGQLKCTMIGEEISQRLAGLDAAADFVELRSMTIDSSGLTTLSELPPMSELLSYVSAELDANEDGSLKLLRDGERSHAHLSDVKFTYRPLLAVRTKIISTFLSIPILHGEGGFSSNYNVLKQPQNPDHIFDLDLLTIKQVSRELRQLVSKGGRSLLAIPVHFETMANSKKRMDYVQQCRSLFRGNEKRVIYELMGLPDGIPQQRLTEIVSALKPMSRAVIGRFAPEHTNFMAFRTAGLHAVGMDLFEIAEKESVLMKEMEAFVLNAKKNDLKCYVEGIRSLSLFSIAMTMGFDYMAGYAISGAVENAEDIHEFKLDEPFQKIIDGLNPKSGRVVR